MHRPFYNMHIINDKAYLMAKASNATQNTKVLENSLHFKAVTCRIALVIAVLTNPIVSQCCPLSTSSIATHQK